MILDANAPPRLEPISMTSSDADELVAAHFHGLKLHKRLPKTTLWPCLQPEFAERGWSLVEPLEPYVAAGRPICVIPHRALHGVGFHTLPTRPGDRPIGLRTAVFQNPSATNWMTARKADVGIANATCVGRTAPADELEQFREIEAVADALSTARLEVTRPQPDQISLENLSRPEGPWRLLHLACHGIFRSPGPDAGLLLACRGALPPAFDLHGKISEAMRRHLAMPADLRKARVAGRLAFLASCLSARNEEFPGDDLMGVTRAFFASGTVDLIAGAWTVVSSIASEFIGSFYQALLKEGARTADAMLLARRAIADTHPDPFHWGVFVHLGANCRVFDRGA
jgi:CHAT domain-containing protein